MRIEEWKSALVQAQKDFDSGDDPNEILSRVATEPFCIDSWAAFHDWERQFPRNCCFRGQKNYKWALDPTLDRILTSSNRNANKYLNSFQALDSERTLVREFQMAAHLYSDIMSLSLEQDDCLATMQHHGCPTKLLDWTYSPQVALYFAIFEKWEEDSAIWALDMNWIGNADSKMSEALSKRRALNPDEYPEMYCIRPARLNRLNHRIVSQRGLLLHTYRVDHFGYDRQPFGECLLGMLLTEESNATKVQVVSKIHIKQEARFELLEELNRVNVNHATLFPTLDGFARSLGVGLELKVRR